MPWMYHLFWWDHIEEKSLAYILIWKKNFNHGFFQTPLKQNLKLCMIIILLGVYIVILGLMTLTLFQSHRCIQKYKLQIVCFGFLSSVVLNIVWMLHTLKRPYTIWFVWLWCVFKGDNYHVLVCQMSGLVKNFNNRIFWDTINVMNVKLCMMVCSLSFTCSYHFQWPGPYFKVTAMSNSSN